MTNPGKPPSLSFLASSSSSKVLEGGSSSLQSWPTALELPPDPLHSGGGFGVFVGDFREYIRLLGRGYRLSSQTSFPVPMDGDDTFQQVEDTSESFQEVSTASIESDLLGPSPMDRARSDEPQDGTPGASSSSQAAREGLHLTTPWANILNGHPLQDIGDGIVNFVKWSACLLEQGHPLARSPVTRDFNKGVSADYIEEIQSERPPMDWEELNSNFKLVPSIEGVNESIKLCHSRLTDPEVLQALNRRLLLSGRRSRSACEIAL